MLLKHPFSLDTDFTVKQEVCVLQVKVYRNSNPQEFALLWSPMQQLFGFTNLLFIVVLTAGNEVPHSVGQGFVLGLNQFPAQWFVPSSF